MAQTLDDHVGQFFDGAGVAPDQIVFEHRDDLVVRLERAVTLEALGRPVAGFDAWERAAELVPGADRASVTAALARLTASLLRTHARITLTVHPREASVRVDGRSWPASRARWIVAGTMAVSVSHSGYEPVTLEWTVVAGRYLDKSVHLASEPRPVRPLPAPSEPSVVSAPTAASAMTRGKWVAAGASAVFLTVGAVALADAARLVDEAEPVSGESYADYLFRHERNRARHEARVALGAAMLTLAGAAAAAATTLFVLDDAEVIVSPVPGGATVTIGGSM